MPHAARGDAARRTNVVSYTTPVAAGSTTYYYDVRQEYASDTLCGGDAANCVAQPTSVYQPVRLAVDLAPESLQLGELVSHVYEGVAYTALENADGFSVITEIEGAVAVIDDTSGRIRARWEQNGGLRKYRGLYDSELGASCIAAIDDAGTYRCLPDNADQVRSTRSSSNS